VEAATGVTVDVTGTVTDSGFPLIAMSATFWFAVADVAVNVLPEVIAPVK
jgi:predicted benzoate:H+ symporter BenE